MNFYFNQFNYGFNGIFRRNNSTNAMFNSFKKNTNQKLIDSINEKLEKYNKNANKVDSVALRSVSEEIAKSEKARKSYNTTIEYATVDEVKAGYNRAKAINSAKLEYAGNNISARNDMYDFNDVFRNMKYQYGSDDYFINGSIQEADQNAFDRQMVNRQIDNILSENGIEVPENEDLKFTIDPYSYEIKVSGSDNEELMQRVETALNQGNNGKELYNHIYLSSKNSWNESSQISEEGQLKRHINDLVMDRIGVNLSETTKVEGDFITKEGLSVKDLLNAYIDADDEGFKEDRKMLYASYINQVKDYDYNSGETQELSISYNSKTGLHDLNQRNGYGTGDTDWINKMVEDKQNQFGRATFTSFVEGYDSNYRKLDGIEKENASKALLESIQKELQQQIDEMSSKGDSPAVKWFKEKAAAWEMVREQMEEYKNRDVILETINNKLAAGAKLTKEEMDHLRVKDPQKYQRLKASEAEQKAYENEMKAAKTKDEVDRLKMNRIGQALSSVKSIMNNPNIPEGAKLGLVSEIGQKVSRINEITAKYKRSTEYNNLPTDEEKRIAEKEINEAKEAQLRGENTPEEVRPEEGTAVEDAEEKPEIKPEANNNGNNSSVETSKETVEKPVVLQEKKSHNIKPGVRIDMDGNSNIKTKAEAETSREALKVKRSEAQAGYRKIKSLSNSAEASNFTAIG